MPPSCTTRCTSAGDRHERLDAIESVGIFGFGGGGCFGWWVVEPRLAYILTAIPLGLRCVALEDGRTAKIRKGRRTVEAAEALLARHGDAPCGHWWHGGRA